jgi:two-component system sensor histidine kinase YesM
MREKYKYKGMEMTMSNYIQIKFSDMKLNVKIRLYFAIIILFFCMVFLMSFTTLLKYNKEYNQIVQSATTASGFSIDFKSEFDYKMYRVIIIGKSEPFDEANPYEDIKAAQAIAEELNVAARTKECEDRAEAIDKYLDNLSKHVQKIEKNIEESGHYDENILILDNDIHVVTSLVQDTVLEYIYYATMEMETVRAKMESQMVKSLEFSIAMLCLLAVGGFFFSIIISNSISKPIQKLGIITNQVAGGNLLVRSNIKSGAEVKVLSDSLNIMIEKLSNLIETVKIEQSNLREAELKLLQEQINPHFLYNTLDTIIWLAETGKSDTVVKMVSSLSNYFRTSLSKGNSMITIKEEELHVRSYLQIQQLRYGDILDYEILIPQELEEYTIPKITLQPLVENALYHGIKNKRGKGRITVLGKKEGDYLQLLVCDNGLGMPDERLSQVRRGLTVKDTYQKDFYGLYNVNERIHLYYGQEYGIEIRSKYLEGTEVVITMPYKQIEGTS